MKIISKTIILLFIIPSILCGDNLFTRQRDLDRKNVADRHSSDLKRKNQILRKIRGFINETNTELRLGHNFSRITSPVDVKEINDLKKINHNHSGFIQPDREYAFITAGNVKLRSEPDISSEMIDKLKFAERVEVLAGTEFTQKIGGMANRWFLLRRSNRDEGWSYGAYLSDKKPHKKEILNKGTDRKSLFFKVPLKGKISSKFGYRVHPVSRKKHSFHSGIDIAAPSGTPVKAAADGIVKISKYNRNGYGNLIVVSHEKGLSTYYGHLSRRGKRTGQRVKKGEVIGKVGSTGRSTGPHLHFEIRRGNTALNPDAFLR